MGGTAQDRLAEPAKKALTHGQSLDLSDWGNPQNPFDWWFHTILIYDYTTCISMPEFAFGALYPFVECPNPRFNGGMFIIEPAESKFQKLRRLLLDVKFLWA